MIDLKELNDLLPVDGLVVIRREKGNTVGLRLVKEDEHISTLIAMLEVAKLAGYSIVAPNGNKL
jgi:hypothetical protein